MTNLNWNDVEVSTKKRGRGDKTATRAAIEGALMRPDLSAAQVGEAVVKAGFDVTAGYAALPCNIARATVDYLVSSEATIKVNGRLFRLVNVQPEPTLVKKPEDKPQLPAKTA